MISVFLLLLSLTEFSYGDQIRFSEVNPDHTTVQFRNEIQKALVVLRDNPLPLSQLTLQSIQQNRVFLDTLGDLTESDFQKILNDFKREGVRVSFSAHDYPLLQKRNSRVLKALSAHLDGYMWENRIYISKQKNPEELASTLVHEVNHVLNRSEVHYYESATNAFMEEFRAFYVEALFKGQDVRDQRVIREIKERVITDYGLDLDINKMPNRPDGLLIPNPENWSKNWK